MLIYRVWGYFINLDASLSTLESLCKIWSQFWKYFIKVKIFYLLCVNLLFYFNLSNMIIDSEVSLFNLIHPFIDSGVLFIQFLDFDLESEANFWTLILFLEYEDYLLSLKAIYGLWRQFVDVWCLIYWLWSLFTDFNVNLTFDAFFLFFFIFPCLLSYLSSPFVDFRQ